MTSKLTSVLCCDGPYNGDYVEIADPQVGYTFMASFHWGEGHYEVVEWPVTDEIVAYWRDDASNQ
jgi:hypothetical protein